MVKKNYAKTVVVVAFIVAIYLAVRQTNVPSIGVPTSSELSTDGYTQVQVNAGSDGIRGVVVLTGNCYQVTGNTDPWIADAISNGQAGKVNFRPTIYDVTKDAFNALGVKVLMVKVIAVQNSTFIGRLVLQQGNTIVSLDSKPSDATAIAVRFNAPVYTKNELMTRYGQKVC
jgi:CRISPR/Cas system-associated endoribonuclease Cas2